MVMKQRDIIMQYWMMTETALAQKSPVMEAEYAYDERTALSLYDCLIPKLKENVRLIRPKYYTETVEDYVSKSKIRHLELELSKRKVPKLLEENGRQSAIIK